MFKSRRLTATLNVHMLSGAVLLAGAATFAGSADAAERFTRTLDLDVDSATFAECVAPSQSSASGAGKTVATNPASRDLIEVSGPSAIYRPMELEVIIRDTDDGTQVVWNGPASINNEAMIDAAIACAQEGEYDAWIAAMTPEAERITLETIDPNTVDHYTGFIARATFKSDQESELD